MTGCTAERPTVPVEKVSGAPEPATKAETAVTTPSKGALPEESLSFLMEPKLKRADLPKPTGEQIAQAENLVMGACSRCHTQEFARWTYSDHAKAWQSLIVRKQKDNPECLPCHTTGFGQPGGLGALTLTSIRKLKAVQCESCHGPMGGHPENPHVKSEPISEEGCITCHDEANSPTFQFDKFLKSASCQM